MKKRFNQLIVSVSILFAILISVRIVMIPTPLNLGEQIGLISLMINYTFGKSKELEDEGKN